MHAAVAAAASDASPRDGMRYAASKAENFVRSRALKDFQGEASRQTLSLEQLEPRLSPDVELPLACLSISHKSGILVSSSDSLGSRASQVDALFESEEVASKKF